MKRVVAALGALVLAMGLGTASVSAHANLVRCSIKNNQVFHVGHTPTSVQAYFAEDLDPKSSWIAVFEGQADHGLVTEKRHSAVNYKNPKEMTLSLPRLGKERYYLIWYTRSTDDGHDAAGIVYFQVK
jgi:methionine-rich copper-binding protein CopC